MPQKPETKVTKPAKCPFCGEPCHAATFNRYGTNERGDITGNLIEAFTQKNGKELVMTKHPFFLQKENFVNFIREAIDKRGKIFEEEEEIIPDAPEGHHLITCESVDGKEGRWKEIFEAFGYDINDAQNGCFFPADLFVACGLRVPLHKGNHESTFGQANPQDLKNAKNYVKAVKDLIQDVLDMDDEEHTICKGLSDESIKKFNKTMFDYSVEIFGYVKDFIWTLTADGFDYQDGGIGCYNRYRSITKKRAGMKLENTESLKGGRSARAVSVRLAENLVKKGKCSRNHKADGCKPSYPFTDAQWYKNCRYNEFDEDRFKSV